MAISEPTMFLADDVNIMPSDNNVVNSQIAWYHYATMATTVPWRHGSLSNNISTVDGERPAPVSLEQRIKERFAWLG